MFNLRLNELGLNISRNLKFEFDTDWQKPFLIHEIRKQIKKVIISDDYASRKYKDYKTSEEYQKLEEKVGDISDFLFSQVKEENFKEMALDRDVYKNWHTNLFYLVNKDPDKFQVIYEFVFDFEGQKYYLKFKVHKGDLVVKSFHPDEPKEKTVS